jgi:hypothetical protein
MSFFRFGGDDGASDHFQKLRNVVFQGLKLFRGQKFGSKKKFKPVKRFIGFFLGNREFMDEIRRTLGVAPTEVPERSICRLNTNSFFSSQRYL